MKFIIIKNMKKVLLVLVSLYTFSSFSQVGIGITTPHVSAMLDLSSTSKGFLPPRMTFEQKNAILAPVAGLVVWCTNCGINGEMQVYNGTTWTNLMGGTTSVSLPLDTTNSTPSVAYSLRLLKSSYSGNAIKVRRSSDNTESDIGFTNTGVLNEAALLSFVGNGDGYVTTWYDQSGNGRNLANTTVSAQPQIVTSGVVYKQNNRPAIFSILGSQYRLFVTPSSPIVSNYMSLVGQSGTSNGQYSAFMQQAGPSAYLRLNPSNNFEVFASGTNTITTTTPQTSSNLVIYSALMQSGTLFANGSLIGTTSGGTSIGSTAPMYVFNAPGGTFPLNGSISELILFPSTVDRTILELNQGSYYGIIIN